MLTTGIFRSKWWMVATALMGLMANTGVIQNFALAVFIKPVTEDLGITRTVLTSALALLATLNVVMTPLFGKAIDHFGLRAVHLFMITGFALGTAALAFLRMPYGMLVFIFLFQHLFGAGQSPVAYSKGIATWFDKDRGLALGIAIAGVGLGVAVIPPYANYLIVHYGWRVAYVGMGVAILVLALVPVLLFEREPPILPERARPKNDASVPGLSLKEAVAGWRFWAMTFSFFAAIVAINGTLTQVVPLLTDRGVPLAVAVAALSVSGLALTGGRIVSGFCLDRFHGPYVAAFFFVCSGVGVALLAGNIAPVTGTVLCGLGIGAEVDLMAFFVSRYFGLRAFGAVYGLMFALFGMGVGLGPFLMSLSHDYMHSYVPMMIVFEAVLAVVCLLLLSLGPYRFASARQGETAKRAPMPAPAAAVTEAPGARLARLPFFAASLVLWLAVAAIAALGGAGPLMGVVAISGVAVQVALAVPRLNDMGQSGWYAGLFLVPFLNLLFLAQLLFEPAAGRAAASELFQLVAPEGERVGPAAPVGVVT